MCGFPHELQNTNGGGGGPTILALELSWMPPHYVKGSVPDCSPPPLWTPFPSPGTPVLLTDQL